jgi:apolipoprotein N-acyltransferase
MTQLSKIHQLILILFSFLIVAFGQPAWHWLSSFLAATVGYALFWRVILSYSEKAKRFWIGTAWFAAVQAVQLSWAISHPFLYIYVVYFLMTFLLGLQFGWLCIYINAQNFFQTTRILSLAAFWTLLEWARLFFLSGFSWNPIGLAWTANLYSLQMVSLFGVFGLTFWVIGVNLYLLKIWFFPRSSEIALGLCLATLPFVYGFLHVTIQDFRKEETNQPLFHALLVQPVFEVEEAMVFKDANHMIEYVMEEWRQILQLTKKHLGKPIDLIVLPEFVVPYGTYSPIFSREKVLKAFEEIFGIDSLKKLPTEEPFVRNYKTPTAEIEFVNNAFWLQGLANLFDADVVAGLEDAEDIADVREYYSSAQHFKPLEEITETPTINRYEKRVLVPMGEYIPFEFCKKFAASYGIQSSFTEGKTAKVFETKKLPIGFSICYEETFGHLMRDNRVLGAGLLVNLTSDAWYPNSRLPKQHFDHARLRTVENGIPLLRACNTGITCGVDSLGRSVAVLGEDDFEAQQTLPEALYVEVSSYSYKTLYSRFGDHLIVGFSFLMIFLFFILPRKEV